MMLRSTAASLPRRSTSVFAAAPVLHYLSQRQHLRQDLTNNGTPAGRRSLAARAGKEDKSWQELLRDAGDLAKSSVSKVAASIKDVASSVLAPNDEKPKSITPAQRQREREREELQRMGIDNSNMPALGGGLFGKAMGGLIGAAMGQLGKEVSFSGLPCVV